MRRETCRPWSLQLALVQDYIDVIYIKAPGWNAENKKFHNHNGGSIEFGPDGFLYIGLGDGGFHSDPYEQISFLSRDQS